MLLIVPTYIAQLSGFALLRLHGNDDEDTFLTYVK